MNCNDQSTMAYIDELAKLYPAVPHARRKALEAFSPRVLRLMFALAPWERSMTYGDAAVSEAARKDEVLQSFFARAQALLKKFGHSAAGAPAGGDGVVSRLPTRWEVRGVCTYVSCWVSSPCWQSSQQ